MSWISTLAVLAACEHGSPSGPSAGSAGSARSAGSAGSGSAAVSRDDCRAILEKSDRLIGQDPDHPRAPEKIEREIDECVANATPAMVTCALAASTLDEMKACEHAK